MNKITVETTIKAPLDKVWKCWNEPEHIGELNNWLRVFMNKYNTWRPHKH